MLDKLSKFEARYKEIEKQLSLPEVSSSVEKSSKLAKELAELKEPVTLARLYRQVLKETEDLKGVLKEKHDKDFLELAKIEENDLETRKQELTARIKKYLAGDDKDVGRDIIVEIRPGTGGDEAGIFAADLYRMYAKYAVKKGWTVEEMAGSFNEAGGVKEVIFSVKGRDAYRRLKFESGVHRVQRVPVT